MAKKKKKPRQMISYFKSRSIEYLFQIILKTAMVGGICALEYGLHYTMWREKIPIDYNGELMLQAQKNVYKKNKWGDVMLTKFWVSLVRFINLDTAYNQRVRAVFQEYFDLAEKNKFTIYKNGKKQIYRKHKCS
jgi:hypothetical protein